MYAHRKNTARKPGEAAAEAAEAMRLALDKRSGRGGAQGKGAVQERISSASSAAMVA